MPKRQVGARGPEAGRCSWRGSRASFLCPGPRLKPASAQCCFLHRLSLRPTAAELAAVVEHGTLPLVAVVRTDPDGRPPVLLGAVPRSALSKVRSLGEGEEDEAPETLDGGGSDSERESLLGDASGGVGVSQLLRGTALHSVAAHTDVGGVQVYFSRLGVEMAYVVGDGALLGVLTSQQIATPPPS